MKLNAFLVARTSRIIAAVSAIIAVLALIGHCFNLPVLYKYNINSPAVMSVFTAISVFCVSGFIALLSLSPPAKYKLRDIVPWIKVLFFAAPLIICVYNVYFYLATTEFILFNALIDPDSVSDFSFLTTVSLALMLTSTYIYDTYRNKSEWYMVLGVSTPLLLVFYIGLFGMAGHFFGTAIMYNYKMSIPTSMAFIFLSGSLMLKSLYNGGVLASLLANSPKVRAMAICIFTLSIAKLSVESYKLLYIKNRLLTEQNLGVPGVFEEMTIHMEMLTLLFTVLLTIIGLRTCYQLDLENLYVRNLLKQKNTFFLDDDVEYIAGAVSTQKKS